MIAYFDTSAIVPLVVGEPTSPLCTHVWTVADQVATSRLSYVEAAAALASAERMGRLMRESYDEARRRLGTLWQMVQIVEVDALLMEDAADAAKNQGLRGYDAVQFASAMRIASADSIAVAGDHNLLAAWRRSGLATVDTNQRLS
ncbi:type II toxin-antitoxin system VapC family toxin [Microbacterium horticulturae]|uniref:Type II toxin-antitoxin system VapC family toxin n=1 Tax=Microbacterium horticulturae TaxID=3028316 RepID=A0ABY8C2E3_9MICO|nr:type II toxin-antitoxin system VapC family toxin [Microbacterium sp. KACC 23027]WEG10564.1 type II toxin-antitoxin system VapC family toxin [Microbacterium sp. KACC 23027]